MISIAQQPKKKNKKENKQTEKKTTTHIHTDEEYSKSPCHYQ